MLHSRAFVPSACRKPRSARHKSAGVDSDSLTIIDKGAHDKFRPNGGNGVVIVVKNSGKWGAAQARLAALFQDRELFLRTGGQVKFLKITARFQRTAVMVGAAVLLVWIAVTGFMLVRHMMSAGERAELARKEAAVEKSASKVEAYRARVDNVAEDLNARQKYLEALVKTHVAPDAPPAPASDTTTKPRSDNRPSDIADELAQLQLIKLRQTELAEQLVAVAARRTARAETAIRQLGLNPGTLASNHEGMGGPFVAAPTSTLAKKIKDPVFLQLNTLLRRMTSMEQALVALPSSNPASVMMMSSGFGYRSDPFTGEGAMHAGLDFRGPIGTPIMASAPGTVSFAGVKSGYGNVVEIDHGRGIMTRYAHLSGFETNVGAKVSAGQRIARMGSTGRSTGSHLHFEVRLNGEALNPRKFLEANTDVLTQQITGDRAATRI